MATAIFILMVGGGLEGHAHILFLYIISSKFSGLPSESFYLPTESFYLPTESFIESLHLPVEFLPFRLLVNRTTNVVNKFHLHILCCIYR